MYVRSFRSSALSFPVVKSPQMELLLPWNFRSVEHSLLGTFVPVEVLFLGSKNFRSLEHLLPWNFRSSGANVPRTFIPWKCSYCGTFVPMNIPRNMAPIVKKWSKTVAVHLALPLRVRWILAIDLPAVAALFYSPVDFIDALHWCVHWCIELSTDERNKTTPWWIIQRDICFNMSGVSFCWQYFLD